MVQIAKLSALLAVAAAALIVALRLRVPPQTTTIVVERGASLPQQMVRVTPDEIVYQGTTVARVPACPDSPCFKLDALYEQLEAAQPDVPRGAFEPARLVLVELDASTDVTTERQVLNTILATGFWPIVTYRD